MCSQFEFSVKYEIIKCGTETSPCSTTALLQCELWSGETLFRLCVFVAFIFNGSPHNRELLLQPDSCASENESYLTAVCVVRCSAEVYFSRSGCWLSAKLPLISVILQHLNKQWGLKRHNPPRKSSGGGDIPQWKFLHVKSAKGEQREIKRCDWWRFV